MIATFDVDALLDYRARRPLMTFDEDHWADYADPQLALHLVHDAEGTAFLRARRSRARRALGVLPARPCSTLVDQLGVRLTVGMNAIPMAVPHTRPLGVIAHASRPETVASYEKWVGTVQVPSSAGHLLEYRLGQAGHDAAGFAVAVPHYLADTSYPAGCARAARQRLGPDRPALRHLRARGGRPRGARAGRRAGRRPPRRSRPSCAALEAQYDAYLAGSERSLLAEMGGALPTADELGDELERFLAEQADGS